jgi:hypothetical protein
MVSEIKVYVPLSAMRPCILIGGYISQEHTTFIISVEEPYSSYILDTEVNSHSCEANGRSASQWIFHGTRSIVIVYKKRGTSHCPAPGSSNAILTTYSFQIHFDINLTHTLRCTKWFLPITFRDKIFVWKSHLSYACYTSLLSQLLEFDGPNSIWRKLRILSSSSSIHFRPLGSISVIICFINFPHMELRAAKFYILPFCVVFLLTRMCSVVIP